MSMIEIKHKGKWISVPVRKTGMFSQMYGLMFRTRNTSNLLFEFKNDVSIRFTSLFVFFPYLSVWLDKDNEVIAWRIVPPFRVTVRAPVAFRRVVEVPINACNEGILKIFRRGRGNV